jgi:hypothetical protein
MTPRTSFLLNRIGFPALSAAFVTSGAACSEAPWLHRTAIEGYEYYIWLNKSRAIAGSTAELLQHQCPDQAGRA